MNVIMQKMAPRAVPCRLRARKGFTLVEVIVVLVILAILAAIAIPALTGYIDKAEDKKYIAQARDAATAMRAVINEAYADGSLANKIPESYKFRLTTGESAYNSHAHVKMFNVGAISHNHIGEDFIYLYHQKASELIGIPFASSKSEVKDDPGFWDIHFFAPKGSSEYTIFNPPAYIYYYHPNGSHGLGSGEPEIIVSYNMKIDPNMKTHSDFMAIRDSVMSYQENAGYKVYHIKE
ncbi:MAG: prepilin-type N-terminal cleavage/methylation domain-containing protein [Clostridiales Family XIII bacterium]|jgi:prepilin-type N-terminal cleavage/methylation domain-containing protein|nr:prepilin-type N-terminal cleavage/methylation domain-containing protein [Clostridiales Family XIII bacterium]